MRASLRLLTLFALLSGSFAFAQESAAQNSFQGADPHSTPEWALVAPHLPDPLSATSARLETAGDVLRARRFPADGLTFYKAAMVKGGDPGRLLKKEGVVHLELQHGLLARLAFQQAVRLNKKDAEGWNDMGAADFMLGNHQAAVSEYKHAVKLNRASAIFHSNLSLAYFELQNARGARRELARALELDPTILSHNNTGGYNLQILASAHYGQVCLEMARIAARGGDRETTIDWLTKASERGLDVRAAVKGDAALEPYLQDERVKTALTNNPPLPSRELSGRSPLRAAGPGLPR